MQAHVILMRHGVRVAGATRRLRARSGVGGQRGTVAGPFPTAPPRTVLAGFRAHGSLAPHSDVVIKLPVMQLHMTDTA